MSFDVYYKELSLNDGFHIASLPKHSRIVVGKEVSLCSGIALYKAIHPNPIACWRCRAVSDRWIMEKNPRDLISKPVLNLYAVKVTGRLVMMTRDHIIPRSLGGVDANENLRPGCAICNGGRGNKMTKADLKFMEDHPELISMDRVVRGRESIENKLEVMARAGRPDMASIREHILKPYEAARQILESHHARKSEPVQNAT